MHRTNNWTRKTGKWRKIISVSREGISYFLSLEHSSHESPLYLYHFCLAFSLQHKHHFWESLCCPKIMLGPHNSCPLLYSVLYNYTLSVYFLQQALSLIRVKSILVMLFCLFVCLFCLCFATPSADGGSQPIRVELELQLLAYTTTNQLGIQAASAIYTTAHSNTGSLTH